MFNRQTYLNQLRPGHTVTNAPWLEYTRSLPPCWEVAGLWHLTGEENEGRHNVYVDLIGIDNRLLIPPMPQLLNHTWEGRRLEEPARPTAFDKQPPEPAANIPLWHGQVVTIWVDDLFDQVSNLRTDLADEGPGNTLFHHSYYVVFHAIRERSRPSPPDHLSVREYANLRRTPGYRNKPEGDIISVLPPGAVVEPLDGPLDVGDGLRWFQVVYDTVQGYVAYEDPFGVQLLGPLIHCLQPVDAPITQYFGEHPEFYGQIPGYSPPLKGHNGLDYGAPIGTPVAASDDGVVERMGWDDTGFGLMIMLRHGWGQTLYAHLSKIDVQVGRQITKGQKIGQVGNTGMSTGPHLHFGMKMNGNDPADGWGGYSDPLPFL